MLSLLFFFTVFQTNCIPAVFFFACVVSEDVLESSTIVGLVCVTIKGKMEDLSKAEIEELGFTTRKWIAFLLQLAVEEISVRVILENSILIILSMSVKDAGQLVQLWMADQECVKETFLTELVGRRRVHVVGITNVLGSHDWPLKHYKTSYLSPGR